MTSTRRIFAIVGVLAALFVLGTASMVMATDEAPVETESDAPAVDAPEPAIPVPEDAPVDDTPEWSYRFLVPATLLLGALAVVGTIFMYFVRVTRNRYRVVE